MTDRERENWKKIEEALKEAGKTDCYFYKRAVSINEFGVDPLDKIDK